MIQSFSQIKQVRGEVSLPGDKSISHRTLIFSAMANGQSVIKNLSDGADVRSTINCLNKLGVRFEQSKELLKVNGVGFKGFKAPDSSLDCGNSGTTARLLSGLLIAQNFETELLGDKSLSGRPMKRLTDPLGLMGGELNASINGTLPLRINPSKKLIAINHELKVPSAQVKSAILIAGLHIEDETNVIESIITRDHTERMLGLEIRQSGDKIISKSSIKNYPLNCEYFIPGDISSASFLIVATLISKNSTLRIRNVSLNKTRSQLIELLKKMGGKLEIIERFSANNEEYGDLLISSSELKNVEIDEKIVPSLIDEIPVLAVAGSFAEGKFEIRNCKELRFKESDRIKSICTNLIVAGLDVEEYDDGFAFDGERLKTDMLFDSYGDHRIAMAFAIYSMLSNNNGKVKDFECVNISNPGFLKQINSVCTFV
jgi:3-phosphoshikimate 1-carboxyvinyltransferase